LEPSSISATSSVEVGADPMQTLSIMDRCGVGAAAIVPLAVEGECPAHNDWLDQFCATDPARLWGVAQVPADGLESATGELRRIGERPSVDGFLLTAYPNGTAALDPTDDQFWALAAAIGKPLVIRGGLGKRGHDWRPAATVNDAVTFDDVPRRQIELLFAGVLERFPTLQFLLAGVDCGWVPYFEYLANDNYLRHSKATLRDRQLPELPSRIFAKHFSYAITSDAFGLANRDRLGVSRLLWAVDLLDSRAIDAVAKSLTELEGIPPHERRAIVSSNALQLFNRAKCDPNG
jgi:predicted TIM-barrel fold metal-dependent hydrolase